MDKYCDGVHTPGEAFESGNVYCKGCGELLNPTDKDQWPDAPCGESIRRLGDRYDL